jgi:hypothetical protein
MKHPPLGFLILTLSKKGTVVPGQFRWGICPLKSNEGVHKLGLERMEIAPKAQG